MARLIAEGRAARSANAPDSARRARRLAFALALRGHMRESLAISRSSEAVEVAELLRTIPPRTADSLILKSALDRKTCVPCAVSVWGMIGDTTPIHQVMHLADSIRKVIPPPVPAQTIDYVQQLSRAYLTLARHDTVRAIEEFKLIPDSACHACGREWLTYPELLYSQGRNAEAAASLDEIGVLNNPFGVLVELQRGRVAERLGDKARARDAYAFVAGMWQNGDSVFKAYSEEARAGLKRLSGENSGVTIPVKKP
jgi:hypothetical protein